MNGCRYAGILLVLASAAMPILPDTLAGVSTLAVAAYLWRLSAILSAMQTQLRLQQSRLDELAKSFEKHLEFHASH